MMNLYGHIYHPRSGNHYREERVRLTGHTYQQRINVLHDKLQEEDPDVFVSHKNEDQHTAEQVAKKIAQSGLKVYLDVWDESVDGDGPELVDYIESVIECCSSLIAVVSQNTVTSWWVPLEIGIATAEDLYLGTYLMSSGVKRRLPSYLWKWPVLVDSIDLGRWCKEQQKTHSTDYFYQSLMEDYPYMFQQ